MSSRFFVLLAVLCWACAPPLTAVAPAGTAPDTTTATIDPPVAHPYDPAYSRALVVVEPLDADAGSDDPTALTDDLERTLAQIGNLTLVSPAAGRRGRAARTPSAPTGPFAIGGTVRTRTGATTTVTLQLYLRDLRAGMIVGAITVHGSATDARDDDSHTTSIERARAAAFAAATTAIWERFQQIL